MLSGIGLSVTLGRTRILSDIALTAEPGQVTAIVGPNGSGKSTLLRAISGDIACDGHVALNDQSIRALKPWQLAAMRAVLPQASVLTFPFTVREVVQMGAESGVPGHPGDVVSDALRLVDMGHKAGTAVQDLSGGEQQRVHLARVLAQIWQPVMDGAPRWLLLDEPVASLDIAHQLDVMTTARDYARGGGGVVVVMHDLNLTAMFADRVVMLRKGRVVASGTPGAVLTSANLSEVYGCRLRVNEIPAGDAVFLLPHSARC